MLKVFLLVAAVEVVQGVETPADATGRILLEGDVGRGCAFRVNNRLDVLGTEICLVSQHLFDLEVLGGGFEEGLELGRIGSILMLDPHRRDDVCQYPDTKMNFHPVVNPSLDALFSVVPVGTAAR